MRQGGIWAQLVLYLFLKPFRRVQGLEKPGPAAEERKKHPEGDLCRGNYPPSPSLSQGSY